MLVFSCLVFFGYLVRAKSKRRHRLGNHDAIDLRRCLDIDIGRSTRSVLVARPRRDEEPVSNVSTLPPRHSPGHARTTNLRSACERRPPPLRASDRRPCPDSPPSTKTATRPHSTIARPRRRSPPTSSTSRRPSTRRARSSTPRSPTSTRRSRPSRAPRCSACATWATRGPQTTWISARPAGRRASTPRCTAVSASVSRRTTTTR